MTEGAPEAAESAACRYCGRRFPDAGAVEDHVTTLRRAGMLADHKAIHGKARDPFSALDLDVEARRFGRVATAPEDDPTRLPWWVRSLLGRSRDEE